MNYWVRFWAVVGSLVVGLGTFGFLLLSVLFPAAAPVDFGATERLGLTLLAGAALAVLVLSVIAGDGVVASDRPGDRP